MFAPYRRWATLRHLRRGQWVGLLFVAPAGILFSIFCVYVVVYGFLLSFPGGSGSPPAGPGVGGKNYTALRGETPAVSPKVAQATVNTLVGMLVLPIVVLVLGLALALLVNSVRRLRG